MMFMNQLHCTVNNCMRRVGPPASWIYPVLVPNIRKRLTQHHKVLFNLSLSLIPCPLTQQSHKKRHVLYDEAPADHPQDGDVLPISPSSNNHALFIPNLFSGPLHLLVLCLEFLSQYSLRPGFF